MAHHIYFQQNIWSNWDGSSCEKMMDGWNGWNGWFAPSLWPLWLWSFFQYFELLVVSVSSFFSRDHNFSLFWCCSWYCCLLFMIHWWFICIYCNSRLFNSVYCQLPTLCRPIIWYVSCWNPKIAIFERNTIYKTIILGSHVKFPGCSVYYFNLVTCPFEIKSIIGCPASWALSVRKHCAIHQKCTIWRWSFFFLETNFPTIDSW